MEWGDQLSTETALQCCRACRAYEPALDVLNGSQCNTWVWHPQKHQCWLKYQEPSALASAVTTIRKGQGRRDNVPWTSGVWLDSKRCTSCEPPRDFRGGNSCFVSNCFAHEVAPGS